jgi:hypothetical protein
VFGIVWAAAATLDIDTSTLAANNAPVGSCDADGVSTSYGTVFDDVTDLRFEVSSVTVSGIDPACNGLTLNVTLEAGAATVSASTPIDATSETVAVSGALAASLVDGVSVAIG